MSQKTISYNYRLVLLAFIGAAISSWLLYHHVEVNGGYQHGSSFCDINSLFSCSTVAQSKYAEFFGVPVAGLGLLYYLALLFLLLAFPAKENNDAPAHAAFLLFFIIIGLVPTFLLAGVSFFALGAICSMCASLYLLNILLFVLAYRHPSFSQLDRSRFNLAKQYASGTLFFNLASVKGVVSLVVLLVVGFGVINSSSLLTSYYFQPREQLLHAEATMGPIYEKWMASEKIPGLEAAIDDLKAPDYFKGNANAPLVLMEFSDFQCPFCARAAKVLSEIASELSDDVKIVFKGFPLDAACNELIPQGHGHDRACHATKMARCAGAQDSQKFWQMHDSLFALNSWSDESLNLLAEELQLDSAEFSSCMQSTEILARVKTDISLGLKSGVQGTPSFFLNGRRLDVMNLQILSPFVKYVISKRKAGK